MKRRPISITIISWVTIAVGSVALLTGLLSLFDAASALHLEEADAEPLEFGLMLMTRILAVVSGVFMLSGFNWARWLLVFWFTFHIVLSIFHTPLELIVHGVLFTVGLFLLFRPESSTYFRGSRAEAR